MSVDQWRSEMDLYYKYYDTYEACYHLLLCLTQSQLSSVHSRIHTVITEKAGVPNYVIQNKSGMNQMVLKPVLTRSHLYEGLIK